MENNIQKEDLLALVKSKIYTIMFQLTKGELEILRSQIVISKMPVNQVEEKWKSQNATSNIADNQHDSILISQIATSKAVERRGGTQKPPYAFTENGVAMLSSVLRSPLAIQVNIGIMRAFTEFRKIANTLSLPSQPADVVQLRKDFEELKLDIEDILHDQNDINESTRLQLDAISAALAELQAEHRQLPKRKPIGFIQPEDDNDEEQSSGLQ